MQSRNQTYLYEENNFEITGAFHLKTLTRKFFNKTFVIRIVLNFTNFNPIVSTQRAVSLIT
ncbi:hypothetical protein MYP_4239 [Sporocytophaga myxococcoides]|uniref:Uncharacterized protein n=1 Tax=Sporocytophaga myxococcoides TaxID=153721 RepID=A0A098LKJ7_9BACT|nr:hypothetical protein MYP_4239 [Sporocytophaga myxococcoides]